MMVLVVLRLQLFLLSMVAVFRVIAVAEGQIQAPHTR